MTYNGWTNYETWCVHLWLTKPETYAAAQEAARTVRPEPELRDLVETLYDLPQSGLAADLIGNALDAVNWKEIVEALTND